jgi:hypothetical protein
VDTVLAGERRIEEISITFGAVDSYSFDTLEKQVFLNV